MNFIVKNFDELSKKELYELLKVRAKVFVVEQSCAYQDLDENDFQSLHIFYEDNGKIKAYLRAFYKDCDTVQIGRVLTTERGTGLGKLLLNNAITAIKEKTKSKKIYIEAQSYAIGFYEKFGFSAFSDEFLEDGIPHTKMLLKL